MKDPQTHVGGALLREAAREPMLGREEERDLARRAGAGDLEAARRMIVSHLRFVVKIARTYRSSGLPMSDLIQEGTLGLIQAVQRFNPDRGVRLSTYAMWWIRAAMQDHVVRSWSLVRIGTTNAQKALFQRLRQMTADIIDDAGSISDEIGARLARGFGTTTAEVMAVARRLAAGDWSLDRPMDGGDGAEPWVNTIACDTPTPEQHLAEASEGQFLKDAIDKALAMLPPREAMIIRRRYFEEARQTFEAIGRDLGVSKDRVRQLEARALAKLRELMPASLADEGYKSPIRPNGTI
jgi:RNA polymerase sigma-32 factor